MIKAAVLETTEDTNQNASKKYHEHIKICNVTPITVCRQEPSKLLNECRYLVVCGDKAIHPKYYNQSPFEEGYAYDTTADEYELALVKEFINNGRSVLGIGRGMHSINIALGGSLIQDIPSLLGLHHFGCENTVCTHEIKISKNSLLHKSMGLRAIVNSFHKQCIHMPACDVFVAAASHDGVIEAIEGTEFPILGVQWSPEKMIGNTLFEHFFNTYK